MQVESAIVNALKTLPKLPLELTVILSDRGGVEPKSPYLIVQIISTHKIALPRKTISHEVGNVVERLFQTKDYEIALTLHAKSGSEYHEWFQYFNDGVDSDAVDWSFTQQGLGVVTSDEVVYQSEAVNGINYKRAIMGMTLRAEVLSEYTVNNMKGVNVQGDVIDPQAGKIGEVLVDIDF